MSKYIVSCCHQNDLMQKSTLSWQICFTHWAYVLCKGLLCIGEMGLRCLRPQLYLCVFLSNPSKQRSRREKPQGLIQDSCSIWKLTKLLIAGLALEVINLL